jgi:hypothetical protein
MTTTAEAEAAAASLPSANGVGTGSNTQQGDDTLRLTQAAPASTGDGVAGQVIGAVTSAGGSAVIVARNTSQNDDVTSGDATSLNDTLAAAGPAAIGEGVAVALGSATASAVATGGGGGSPATADTFSALAVAFARPTASAIEAASNTQSGDDLMTVRQTAQTTTGDAVGGQVLGVVSAGAASLDASNTTTDSTVTSGDATSKNQSVAATGPLAGAAALSVATATVLATSTPENSTNIHAVTPENMSAASPTSVQQGNNRTTTSQLANAISGDAVAGQVAGVVTAAGGHASGVLANTSSGIDSRSGDATFDNVSDDFTGLVSLNFPFAIP